MSSFIEPERSITKAMSRGLTAATADACWLIADWPKMRPKNSEVAPPLLELVRAVTLTAVAAPVEGVNVQEVAFHVPNWMSLEFSWIGLPAA